MAGDRRVPLRQLGGRFYRAIVADRLAALLDPPAPQSAGRYHRHGEPALYLTPEADWAAIAVGRYQAEDGLPRLIVPLDVSAAQVVDQHDEAVCQLLAIDRDQSNLGWRQALERGDEPPSWAASDAARRCGADGIIDRSRGIVGGWHVTLFRWNVPGAPLVVAAGQALTMNYAAARARWAAPQGWSVSRAVQT